FYPHYFKGFYAFGGNFAWMGLHLWYLEVLFVYSLIFIPLLMWLKAPSGRAWLNQAFSRWMTRPGSIYLLAIPPMLLMAFLSPQGFWGQRGFGGWPLPI